MQRKLHYNIKSYWVIAKSVCIYLCLYFGMNLNLILIVLQENSCNLVQICFCLEVVTLICVSSIIEGTKYQR